MVRFKNINSIKQTYFVYIEMYMHIQILIPEVSLYIN